MGSESISIITAAMDNAWLLSYHEQVWESRNHQRPNCPFASAFVLHVLHGQMSLLEMRIEVGKS